MAIHAGLAEDPSGWEMARTLGVHIPATRGAIIGVVTVADCVRDSDSSWAAPDMWHWVLTDPVQTDPLPFRGRQGLIRAPAVIVQRLGHQLQGRDIVEALEGTRTDEVAASLPNR